MAFDDGLPPIPIDDWQAHQADQFGTQTSAQIATIAPPADSATPGFGFDPSHMAAAVIPPEAGAPPSSSAPADAPSEPVAPPPPAPTVAPDPAPAPFVPDAQPDFSGGPQSSAPPPATAAGSAVGAAVGAASTGPDDQVVATLNAATAAGVDPQVLLAARNAGVQMPDLFQAATDLKGKLDAAGGNLIQGLSDFGADPHKVLDQLFTIQNPAPVAAPTSSSGTDAPISSSTATTAGLSGGGALAGQIGDAGRQILSSAATTASWLGDQGQKALQAVLVTEGGLGGARGDQGNSGGPLQFFRDKGQLPAFAASLGLSQSDAMTYAEQHPDLAVQWAIGTPDKPGYLGQAILNGIQRGLSGADLATYAQQHGQVSVSPERAGQNYNALFGAGGGTVSTGGAQPNPAGGTSPGPTEALQRVGSNLDQQQGGRNISQFGDPQLTSAEAYADCGPAAAVRFASAFGRNPTLREATDLAKQVGWTQDQGMAGLDSEKNLMDKLGVPTKVVRGPAWDAFAREVQTGNPVTISTADHYFTADAFNADTGAFHVGQSGLDLKGGSEWMTPAQMTRLMGEVQGGLLADNPTIPAPSTVAGVGASGGQTAASNGPTGPLDWLGQQKDALGNAITDAGQRARSMVSDAGQAVTSMFAGPHGDQPVQVPGGGWSSPGPRLAGIAPDAQTAPEGGPIGAAASAVGTAVNALGPGDTGLAAQGLRALGQTGVAQTLNQARLAVAPIIGEPNNPIDTLSSLLTRYADPSDPTSLHIADRMTPEDRQAYNQASLAVAGVEMGGAGEAGAGAAPLGDQAQTLAGRTPGGGNLVQRVLGVGGDAAAAAPAVASDVAPVAGMVGRDVAAQTPAGQRFLQAAQQVVDDPASVASDRQAAQAVLDQAAPTAPAAVDTPAVSSNGAGGRPPIEPPATTTANSPASPDVPPPAAATPPVDTTLPPMTTPVRDVPARPLPPGAEPITLSPAEETARLRLQDFPPDVRDTIAQNAQAVDWARTQRRGVIPDAEAEQMAQQYAADHTLDQVIRQGAAGKAYTTEQIRALRNATAAQAVAVNDAAAVISKGNDSSAALQSFFVEGQKLQRLVQIAEGAKAEAGRSLRAYQDPANLVNLAPNDAVTQISKMIGGDRTRLLGAVSDYQKLVDSGAGPVQIANFWSALKNPVGPGDWFRLIRYNSMLSGPRSVEINTIGNALELPWRLARDTAASTLRGRPGEIQPEWNGMFAGLATANQHFMETMTQGITTDAALRGEIPQSMSARLSNPVAKGVATALEVPGRLMGAADEWAQAIAYHMALGREAAVQASREGLRGDPWTERVSHILANPTTVPKLMAQADGVAQRMTYHGDMGNVGEGLQSFTRHTGVIGNLILPFLRTVYHITARGIDRSPVGVIGTGIDVARGAYGPLTRANLGEALAGRSTMPKGVAPLGERVGDNLMGSAVFAAVYLKALDGSVSAAGPDDPSRRSMLQSEGWQPYSVHLGDKWVSYANWGPAAIPFALAGAAAEAQRYGKPGASTGALILDGMRRSAQVVQQQTYLQSIGAAWQGMNDPQRYGYQWVNSTIGSLIPYGAAINTLGQATDDALRRPDKFDVGDAIRSRLPANTPIIGGRETVPVSQDVLGRPNANTRSGFSALNPLMVSPERADPVLQALDSAGVTVGSPPSSVTRGGSPIALTPDEQRQVQQDAGAKIADRVAVELAAPSFKALAPDGQFKRLQSIVDRARQQAADSILDGLSDAEYRRRKAEGMTSREKIPVSGR